MFDLSSTCARDACKGPCTFALFVRSFAYIHSVHLYSCPGFGFESNEKPWEEGAWADRGQSRGDQTTHIDVVPNLQVKYHWNSMIVGSVGSSLRKVAVTYLSTGTKRIYMCLIVAMVLFLLGFWSRDDSADDDQSAWKRVVIVEAGAAQD